MSFYVSAENLQPGCHRVITSDGSVYTVKSLQRHASSGAGALTEPDHIKNSAGQWEWDTGVHGGDEYAVERHQSYATWQGALEVFGYDVEGLTR